MSIKFNVLSLDKKLNYSKRRWKSDTILMCLLSLHLFLKSPHLQKRATVTKLWLLSTCIIHKGQLIIIQKCDKTLSLLLGIPI